VLTRPVVAWERGTDRGVRFGLASGLIVTASTDMFSSEREDEPPDAHYAGTMDPDPATFALWETLVATTSLPITRGSTAFAEAGLVFDGLRFAGEDWVSGPPLVVVLGLSKEL
jgi:hypothetical protein